MEIEKNNFKCFFCGGNLIWESDFNANEVAGDDYEDDDFAVASYFTCQNCGRFYEIREPNKEERETTYKDYWID